MKKTVTKFSIAKEVTKRVLEAINGNDSLPWIKQWKTSGRGVPFNPLTKVEYRGANFFTLSMLNGIDSQYVTWNQATEKGGVVRKGAKASQVTYYNFSEKDVITNGVSETKKSFFLKYYNVFNTEDVDGIEFDKVEPRTIVLNDFAEQIITKLGIKVNVKGQTPCYIPSLDEINMPIRDRFFTDDSYYATFFHEIIHATGEKLGRKLAENKADEAYEELIAELGSSMLCVRISDQRDHPFQANDRSFQSERDRLFQIQRDRFCAFL